MWKWKMRVSASEQKQWWKKNGREKVGKGEGWSARGMLLFSHLSHTQMFREERRRIGERTGKHREGHRDHL